MVAGSQRWLAVLISLLAGGWLVFGDATAPAMAASGASDASPAVTLKVALDVGNVHRFSAREKTYTVEGTMRLSAPAAVMQHLQAAGVEPVELLRFQNQVDPWDSLMEPATGLLHLGELLGRDYRFNGNFYSDDINFRGYPFGTLPLQLRLVPVGSANGAIRAYPYDPTNTPQGINSPLVIRLQADPGNSSVSQQTNMNGYRLQGWRLINERYAVEMKLFYNPSGWASLVKWLLPLAITMVVMLLTPNLRSSFSSERLAIPPVILLTLVFMQQAYRDSLPPLPYLTVLDGLYAFSYLVTLVFFCEFIVCANRISQDGREPDPARLRRFDRLENRLQLASLGGYAVLLVWALNNR
ncbi:MAG: hypothetical protein VKM97_07640 [Cyanobacteriota bacterium]|nr:hypothetical protein [Cyanobacteriota bacterium]